MAVREGSELIVSLSDRGDEAPLGTSDGPARRVTMTVLRAGGARGLIPLISDWYRPSLQVDSPIATGATALAGYFQVDAPLESLESLAGQLREVPGVLGAFIKPPAQPAVAPPLTTPDYSGQQAYVAEPPAGVNSRWARSQPGGGGANIQIIDVEGAWRTTHEDLAVNSLGVIGGLPSTDLRWRDHGTAVWGVLGGDANDFGITGIVPDALLGAVSIFGRQGWNSATAIVCAAERLSPGDVLLVELHRAGPNATGQGQDGFIPVEWWPDDLAAIRFAVQRGVIVVSAAGNGAEDLDAAAYDQAERGFPSTWRNPLRRGSADSGSILIGAGAPPSGRFGPDRSRLDFSNYGSCIDAQGWGQEVVTCGYGDLQGGGSEDRWYTSSFSGTSSASPIVVGALAAVQGLLAAVGRPRLTPGMARQLLRQTGSPQQAASGRPVSQRIGNRPDIEQMYRQAP